MKKTNTKRLLAKLLVMIMTVTMVMGSGINALSVRANEPAPSENAAVADSSEQVKQNLPDKAGGKTVDDTSATTTGEGQQTGDPQGGQQTPADNAGGASSQTQAPPSPAGNTENAGSAASTTTTDNNENGNNSANNGASNAASTTTTDEGQQTGDPQELPETSANKAAKAPSLTTTPAANGSAEQQTEVIPVTIQYQNTEYLYTGKTISLTSEELLQTTVNGVTHTGLTFEYGGKKYRIENLDIKSTLTDVGRFIAQTEPINMPPFWPLKIIDVETGNDLNNVMFSWDHKIYFSENGDGPRIVPATLQIHAESASDDYARKALYGTVKVTDNNSNPLTDGFKIRYTSSNAGSSYATEGELTWAEWIGKIRIKQDGGYDITQPYRFAAGTSTVTVQAIPTSNNYTASDAATYTLTVGKTDGITIAAEGGTYVYDGQPHGAKILSFSSAHNHTPTVEYSTDGGNTWAAEEPKLTNVGTMNVTVRASFKNYNPAEATYTVTVNPRTLGIKASNLTSRYQGKEIKQPSFYVYNYTAATGDKVASVTNTTQDAAGNTVAAVEVGTYQNVPSGAKVENAAGEDVSGNYDIKYYNGTITIEPRRMGLEVKDAQKLFGDPDPAYSIIERGPDGKVPGQKFFTDQEKYSRKSTDGYHEIAVGEYEVTIRNPKEGVVFDAEGNDVTKNYEITVTPGTLTIKENAALIPVKVRYSSNSYPFTGEKLNSDQMFETIVNNGTPVDGLTFTYDGETYTVSSFLPGVTSDGKATGPGSVIVPEAQWGMDVEDAIGRFSSGAAGIFDAEGNDVNGTIFYWDGVVGPATNGTGPSIAPLAAEDRISVRIEGLHVKRTYTGEEISLGAEELFQTVVTLADGTEKTFPGLKFEYMGIKLTIKGGPANLTAKGTDVGKYGTKGTPTIPIRIEDEMERNQNGQLFTLNNSFTGAALEIVPVPEPVPITVRHTSKSFSYTGQEITLGKEDLFETVVDGKVFPGITFEYEGKSYTVAGLEIIADMSLTDSGSFISTPETNWGGTSLAAMWPKATLITDADGNNVNGTLFSWDGWIRAAENGVGPQIVPADGLMVVLDEIEDGKDGNVDNIFTSEYDGNGHYGKVKVVNAEGADVSGATLWFRLKGQDDDAWTTTEPYRNAVGTTIVEVKATHNNYNESAIAEYTLTVTKRPITIKVKNVTKKYGEQDPAFEVEITSGTLVGPHSIGNATEAAIQREQGENVGTYALTLNATNVVILPSSDKANAGETRQNNYDITVTNGTLTVNPLGKLQLLNTDAAYEDVPYDGNYHYGKTQNLSATVAGGGNVIGGVTFLYSAKKDGTYGTDADRRGRDGNGTRLMVAGTKTVWVKATAPGYEDSDPVSFDITVTKRTVSIQIGSQSLTYGQELNLADFQEAYTVSLDGTSLSQNGAFPDTNNKQWFGNLRIGVKDTNGVIVPDGTILDAGNYNLILVDENENEISPEQLSIHRTTGSNTATDTKQSFTVTATPGTLTVKPATLKIVPWDNSTNSAKTTFEKIYDHKGLYGNVRVFLTGVNFEKDITEDAEMMKNINISYLGDSAASRSYATQGMVSWDIWTQKEKIPGGENVQKQPYRTAAGSSKVTVKAIPEDPNNPNLIISDGASYTLTVNPRPLIVQLADAVMTYGDAEPKFETPGYTTDITENQDPDRGLLNDRHQIVQVNFNTAIGNNKDAGEYSNTVNLIPIISSIDGREKSTGIVVQYDKGNGVVEDVTNNYDITVMSGKLTINKSDKMTVTAGNGGGVYDGSTWYYGQLDVKGLTDAELAEVTISHFHNESKEARDTADTKSKPGVTWALWNQGGTLKNQPYRLSAGTFYVKATVHHKNYVSQTVTYEINVAKRPLTITVTNAEKTYGEPDPAEFNYEVEGWQPDRGLMKNHTFHNNLLTVTRVKSNVDPETLYEDYWNNTEHTDTYKFILNKEKGAIISGYYDKNDNADLTHNYDIKIADGNVFTINKRNLTLTVQGGTVTLDNVSTAGFNVTPGDLDLVAGDAWKKDGDVLQTENLQFVINNGNPVTEAGTYPVSIVLDNEEITEKYVRRNPYVGDCYNISVVPGTLTVTVPTSVTPTPVTPAPVTPAPVTPAVTPATTGPVVTELPAVLGEVRTDAAEALVAETPGVLGMRRGTEETEEVLGARRGQTGDVSMVTDYVSIMIATSVLVLFFFGTKKRKVKK